MEMLFKFELDGEEQQLSIPLHVSQISYNDFLDFREKEDLYFEKNTGEEITGVLELMKAINHIVPFKNYGKLLIGEYEERFIQQTGKPPTINEIYGHICYIINDYRGAQLMANLMDAGFVGEELKERLQKQGLEIQLEEIGGRLIEIATQAGSNNGVLDVKYKEEHYELQSKDFLTALSPKTAILTAGEVVAVEKVREAILVKIEKKGGFDAAIEYGLGLDVCAILLRKKDEHLPHDPFELDDFIKTRGEYFKELPMDIVLSVRFFLIFILKRYAGSHGQNTTSSLSKRGNRQTIAKAAGKHKRSRKRKRKPSK